MECLELDSSPSSSSSSSCKLYSPDSESLAEALPVSLKRKGGRKKFMEMRQPVLRGVRQRKGNKWVCKVREPYKKSRIWLGTFLCPEMAARAYDVAALAVRGKSAALNFPNLASILPRAKSSSAEDIKTAALAAAEAFRPTSSTNMVPSHSTSSTHIDQRPGCSSTPISNEKKPACLLDMQVVENSSILDHSESLETNANEFDHPLFIDEEASFNMPGLVESMAEAMLLTPPAFHREVDWDDDTAATINIDLRVDH